MRYVIRLASNKVGGGGRGGGAAKWLGNNRVDPVSRTGKTIPSSGLREEQASTEAAAAATTATAANTRPRA